MSTSGAARLLRRDDNTGYTSSVRVRWSQAVWCFVCLVALNASPVAAQVIEPKSFPAERMRLASDRLGLIDTEWGALISHLSWDIGLWAGYAKNPLVLYRTSDQRRVGALVSDRVGFGLTGAVGLFDWVQLGFELPLIFAQSRTSNQPGIAASPIGALQGVGIGDLRLIPKLRLLRSDKHYIDLAIVLGATAPTGGQRQYFGDAGFTFQPELVVSRALTGLRLALNIGAVVRPTTRFLSQTVEHELNLRVGVGYHLRDHHLPPFFVDASLLAGSSLVRPFRAFNQTALEVKTQVGFDILEFVAVFVGGGLGLSQGWGIPDWRVFGGLRVGVVKDSSRSVQGTPASAPILSDADNDGVADEVDRCPKDAEDKDGYADEDGCPDLDNDNDGIADEVDRCPSVAEDKDGYADSDGCPELDNDNDGIADTLDRCPNEAEDKDGFADDDGCTDVDNDSDGVVDTRDRCPAEAGPAENYGCADTDRDSDGVIDRLDNCPDQAGSKNNSGCQEKQLVALAVGKVELKDKIYFKNDSDEILPRSSRLLKNIATVIVNHPENELVRVEGHTDNVGVAAYNLSLSDRRARSVVRTLIKFGVAKERLIAKGYGETKPMASNDKERGRARNRRVEFIVVGGLADGEVIEPDTATSQPASRATP